MDKVCGLDVGVAWASGGAVYPLRRPGQDSAGFAQAILFEWHPAPPPRQLVGPSGLFGRLERVVEGALAQIGQQEVARSDSALAMSQTLVQAFGSLRMGQKSDAASVALDVIGVAFSLGALATGVGFIGMMALVGGGVLLLADGAAYGMEITGHGEAAETFKKRTEVFRLVATVMTLPDAAWGGAKAIRELLEVRELRTASRTTAAIAGTLAGRTANAARASQYAQIAERARLKAQIRSEQIRGLLLHELTPRATVPPSVYLLLREELDKDNHSAIASVLRRLTFHVVTLHG